MPIDIAEGRFTYAEYAAGLNIRAVTILRNIIFSLLEALLQLQRISQISALSLIADRTLQETNVNEQVGNNTPTSEARAFSMMSRSSRKRRYAEDMRVAA
jgi:hypothetical protein